VSPPAASTAAARTVAPPAPRPRRLQAAGAATRPASTRPARAAGPARTARRRAGPPRRVSGPARRRGTTRQAPPRSVWQKVAVGAVDAARRLPDHRVLDRLVRGRFWIVLVGGALIGMVAIQVAMLRINSDIGRYVDRAANLERANAVLSAENSRLATVTRIQSEGARLGLVMPGAQGIRYVFARPGTDAAKAVATMRAPTAATLVAQPTTQVQPPADAQTTASGTTTTTTTQGAATGTAAPPTGTAAPPTNGTETTAAAGATAQGQVSQPQGTTPGGP
jgi:hypothetical protein